MENIKEQKLSQTYKTVDGVTYFKLRSDFEGDYTKNCGLLGEEIDKNFYFLRGYDIDSIYVDSERNLIITRVNKDYEPLKIKMEDLGKETFRFDKESGTVIVTYPDGTTAKMEGFLVEGKDIRMATDSTIDGDGTIFNPLRLSSLEATGTFAPVEKFFDLTNNIKMPEAKGKGYRVVTKEKIDNFGCLYPLSAVKKIDEKLKENKSQWRIPTKADWDELLNAMELDSEYRNHDSNTNTWLGQIAGSALKSVNLWKKHDTLSKEVPTNGQDVVGMSILPLGIGPDRNEVLDDSDADLEGFSKLGGMWTSTEDNSGNLYVKIFSYNSAKVDQDTYGNGARLSIRLVKDYNYSNYNDVEFILGLPYTTQLVNGICDDMPYAKIWTTINVYDSSPGLDGRRSIEWNDVEDSDRGIKDVYFINEWDGKEWHKKLMSEGDSVVIKNHSDKLYHEWRIIDGVLHDTIDSIMSEFSEELENLNNRIEKEEETRQEEDVKLANDIKTEKEERILEDEKLSQLIANETSNRIAEDKKLSNAISAETANRIAAIKKVENAIETEISNRVAEDEKIMIALSAETNARIAEDENIMIALSAETDTRIAEDEKIIIALSTETDTRIAEDEKLKNNIDENAATNEIQHQEIYEAIETESVERHNNDITPGEYVLEGDSEKETVVPTFGEEVADVKIKISSDFFNFGKILNNDKE